MTLMLTTHIVLLGSLFYVEYPRLIEGIKVYEFSEGGEISSFTTQFAVPNVDSFVICSTHKQYQLNENNKNIYTIFKDSKGSEPYFTIGFMNMNEILYVEIDNWYIISRDRNNLFFFEWIHICLEFR